ncbi:MAG: hypothetical protein INQ03_10890 [Candidatus Heimdallarchaeota archaeon]|nr:hypothetical protein [Candidatus Heimdallarchaeota archaeon]
MDQLDQMGVLLKIFRTPNSMLIYQFLHIYGRSAPSYIGSKLHLSHATLFRNLDLLIRGDLIAKFDCDRIDDKRFTAEYDIKLALDDLYTIELSKDLHDFAERYAKENILIEWVSLLPNLSSIFADTMTNLHLQLNRGAEIKLMKVADQDHSKSAMKPSKVMSFGVLDLEDDSEFFNDITKLIHKYRKNRQIKGPISNPVSFSINVIRFTSEQC